MGIGDWGLGIGDWGLGIGYDPLSERCLIPLSANRLDTDIWHRHTGNLSVGMMATD